jgi:hypothetical protein
MSWNLEGLCIEATYLDTIPVEGVVENSRVAYGGEVKHTIVLRNPIMVYGAKRDRLIIDHKTVKRVRSATMDEVFSPFQTINS